MTETRGRRSRRPLVVFTIGHGARTPAAFVHLLSAAGVTRLIDVRTRPGSRRHPHFGRDALASALPDAGVTYEWWPELGGLRSPRPDSPYTALGVDAFRGYADHMSTPEFADALVRLLTEAGRAPTTVMCAESRWERCHRRMIADALDVAGCRVLHLVEGGPEAHRRSPELRVVGGELRYDVRSGQATLDEA